MDPAIYAAALITVIAALVGGTVQVINAVSSSRDRRDAARERQIALEQSAAGIELARANGQKADAILHKTSAVEVLTNGTNSNLQRALDVMTERNAGNEAIIRQLRQTTADTASVRAITDQQVQAALHSLPPGSVPVLLPPTPTSTPPIIIADPTPTAAIGDILEHERRNRKAAAQGLQKQIEELTQRMASLQETVEHPAKNEAPA